MNNSPVFRTIRVETRRIVPADKEQFGKDYFSAKFSFFIDELVSYGEASSRGIALDCVEITLSNGKNYYILERYDDFDYKVREMNLEVQKRFKSVIQN